MKKVPRLYSLSTLGIRQHQSFDYNFHGFRTDFVGDSGCGKSMIADLLQLIFVGSEVFYPGTDSLDDRDVDGMVLRSSQSRGTEIGYALLNLEILEGQFVVIGTYIESSGRLSKSFVIQAGWDDKQLALLPSPLVVADIIVDDRIPTLDEFKTHLELKGLAFHYYGQRTKYHAFLFKHDILSIDLSQSRQVLRDYANIIQSFSRGKSLRTSDSASLKSFLFGDEKAKEILEKYKKAIEDLQLTLSEYARNKADIDLVTRKQKALNTLKNLKDDFESKQVRWLTKLCAFRKQEEGDFLYTLQEAIHQLQESTAYLAAIRQLISQQLKHKNNIHQTLQEEAEAARENYDLIGIEFRELTPFIDLLKRYTSEDELTTRFEAYDLDKKHYKLLERFIPLLEGGKLLPLPDELNEFTTISGMIKCLDEKIISIKEKLTQNKSFLEFADINNESSFGGWAIRNNKVLDREVESIVMHYKSVHISTQNLAPDKKQYIPDPKLFATNPTIEAKEDAGFWLSNGAIREYIAYVDKQLFSQQNIEHLSAFLENMSADLKSQSSQWEMEQRQLEQLSSIILDQSDFIDFLDAYPRKKELTAFLIDPGLDITVEEFEKGISLLYERETIELSYRESLNLHNNKQRQLIEYEQYVQSLEASEQALNSLINNVKATEIDEIILSLGNLFVSKEHHSLGLITYFEGKLLTEVNKGKWLEKQIESHLGKINFNAVVNSWNYYVKAVESTLSVFNNARLSLQKEPDIGQWAEQRITEPTKDESDFDVAKSLYFNDFTHTVGEFIPADAYKFDKLQNYVELCSSLLPDAFLAEKLEEDTAINTIERYLININEKNKTLNNRKLQKIREILDDVNDEIGKRMDTARLINNFLNGDDKEITGGHRVSLKSDLTSGYDKKWIDLYIKKLAEDNTLFAVGDSLGELLGETTSLEEKMISAFISLSEYRGPKPKIENLLDPNAYFGLTFKMESVATGKVNSGSSGQTYAATALLCIARLSLVNKSGFNKNIPKGIRFMPIDEAEGLGSNFDMLYDIAQQFDYQILTMSINPLGLFKQGEQYIYMLSNNKEAAEEVNYPPFGIFSNADTQAFVSP